MVSKRKCYAKLVDCWYFVTFPKIKSFESLLILFFSASTLRIYYVISGAKITKSRKGIKLTDNSGVISVLDDTGQKYPENSKLAEHYKYFKQVTIFSNLKKLMNFKENMFQYFEI